MLSSSRADHTSSRQYIRQHSLSAVTRKDRSISVRWLRKGNIKKKIKRDVTCLEITVGVDEQIFRFQVAIDDFEEVKIFEQKNDLRRVELTLGLTALQ
jgi:hypothetical protein